MSDKTIKETCERCLETVEVTPEYSFDCKTHLGKFLCPQCTKVVEWQAIVGWALR